MVKPKQPVFLLCGERSGSNLIRVIMNSHSEFLAPEPLHLMRLMWAELGAYGDLSNNENWNALVRHTSLILRHQVGEIGPRFDEDEIKRNVTRRSFADIFDFIYVTALEAKKKRRLFLKELYPRRPPVGQACIEGRATESFERVPRLVARKSIRSTLRRSTPSAEGGIGGPLRLP